MSADRLIHHYFQGKTRQYRKKLRGASVIEKAESLANLREADGYLSASSFNATDGLRLIEQHHPLGALLPAYPSLARMETRMIGLLLNARVQRHEESTPDGSMRQVFIIHIPGGTDMDFPMDESHKAELKPF